MTGKPIAIAVAVFLMLASRCLALHEQIDSPMYRSPDLNGPPVEVMFFDGLKELWLRALTRPEAEVRLRAAGAIALAHERGMKGLDATVPPLLQVLDAPEPHPAVRLAIARTLVALDARKAAPSLLRQLESADAELRDIIEPALAHWNHEPARAVWLKRLVSSTPPRSLVLALQGVAAAREEKAVLPLRKLLNDTGLSGALRIEAARALGAIREHGLENDATDLLGVSQSPPVANRLGAALILRRQGSAEAVAILQRLAKDTEPAVASIALGRLIDIDPKLVLSQIGALLASPDPELRQHAVEALYRAPTAERVHELAGRLQDVHPSVRIKARQHLLKLAEQKPLRRPVLEAAGKVLAAGSWQGLEQAAILLTQLEHRPAAKRLVELLNADRPEVFVTAAWGLRKLAVPDTYPEITKYVAVERDRLIKNKPLPARKLLGELIDHQLSQLNQLLGQEKYTAADTVLHGFVPKQTGMTECRAAAIWALGLFREGTPDAALVQELEARIKDVGSIPPEMPPVQRMSAVAIGRMKAEEALPTLRRFWTGVPTNNPTANACGWAIERITGEPMPAPTPLRQYRADWFLMPIPNTN